MPRASSACCRAFSSPQGSGGGRPGAGAAGRVRHGAHGQLWHRCYSGVVGLGTAGRPAGREPPPRWRVGRWAGWMVRWRGSRWSAVASLGTTVGGRAGNRWGAGWTGLRRWRVGLRAGWMCLLKGADGQLWHRWFEGGWSGSWGAARGPAGRASGGWRVGLRAGWMCLSRGPMVSCGIVGSRALVGGLGAPGRLDGAPAAASWASGCIGRVCQGGSTAQLWHRWFEGGWSGGWEPLGGVFDGPPAVASWVRAGWMCLSRGPMVSVASSVRGGVVGLGATRWVARPHALVRRGRPGGRNQPTRGPLRGPDPARPCRSAAHARCPRARSAHVAW